jgi:hypothetical protein
VATDKLIYKQSQPPADIDAEAGQSTPQNLEDLYLKGINAENTTKDVYNKRLLYKNEITRFSEEYSNLVDFNFAEKHLYGRTSRSFVPIVLSNIGAELVTLKQSSDAMAEFRALDFVEENFTEMAYQFKKATMSGMIDPSDDYLSELLVYKAYENPEKVYVSHLRTYKSAIDSLFKEKEMPITNFDEFITKLMPFLKKTARKQPFTFPAFVKSNYGSIHSSGLVIEIADIKPAADLDKVVKFTNSRNWSFYLNACRSYGFMVDKFYPWRLVADIASSPMLRKASRRGLGDTDRILKTAYTAAHRRYYRNFTNSMLRFYNEVKYPSYEAVSCGGSKRVTVKATKPIDYTPESLSAQYNKFYFFRLYCTIRFIEEESHFAPHEKDTLINNCAEVFRRNENIGLDTFERILNKTFDYVGSLSYIKRKFDRIDLEKQD